MPVLYFTYILIFIIFLLSIILTIIEWFSIHSFSIKISFLEQEIEKKAQEFNNLKKEHQSSLCPSQSQANQTEPIEPANTSLQEDSIQIVRNIRGNFEMTEAPSGFKHSLEQTSKNIPHNAQFHHNREPAEFLNESFTNWQTNTPDSSQSHFMKPEIRNNFENFYDQSKNSAVPDRTDNENLDVLDVINESQFREVSPASAIIPIYSESTKDADFSRLWKRITEILTSESHPKIAIDFSNINFIYDKELDYLENILHFISNQNGSIVFLNCDNELKTFMYKRSKLASLIK